jgi:dephospho-CoA kinase
VFQQPNELKKLTEIVWPEIKKLLEEEIDILFKQNNHKVIIIEAALLIEAEWHTNMNEIWVCIVTEDKVKIYLFEF